MRISLPIVLIVEDNGILRYDIVGAFKTGGWDVLESASAEAAIGFLSAGPRVALLFTDSSDSYSRLTRPVLQALWRSVFGDST